MFTNIEQLIHALPSLTDDDLQAEPCGCRHCDEGTQQGHFACSASSPTLLEAEQRGLVFRSYTDGQWRWFVA